MITVAAGTMTTFCLRTRGLKSPLRGVAQIYRRSKWTTKIFRRGGFASVKGVGTSCDLVRRNQASLKELCLANLQSIQDYFWSKILKFLSTMIIILMFTNGKSYAIAQAKPSLVTIVNMVQQVQDNLDSGFLDAKLKFNTVESGIERMEARLIKLETDNRWSILFGIGGMISAMIAGIGSILAIGSKPYVLILFENMLVGDKKKHSMRDDSPATCPEGTCG